MKKLIKKVYTVIFYNILFTIYKRILPLNSKKVIYISHYGNRFGCNPKAMFDYIHKHHEDIQNIVVLNKQDHEISEKYNNVKFVNFRSIDFLRELATAKYWIVNTNLPGELKPREGTIYFQTWHAAGAFKKFGLDLPSHRDKEKEDWLKDTSHWTNLIVSAESVKDIYARACGINTSDVYATGLPRNDLFYNKEYLREQEKVIKDKYNIPMDKKVILYAPTYRDVMEQNTLQFDFEQLEKALGDEYVFILKVHPLVANQVRSLKANDFLFNLSDLDDIQELLIITDVLITDYSSVIFDYALLGKPILFYAYDLELYDKDMRGFYFPYVDWVPGPIVKQQSEIEDKLKNYQLLYEEWHGKVSEFAVEYNGNINGNATENAVNLLFSNK